MYGFHHYHATSWSSLFTLAFTNPFKKSALNTDHVCSVISQLNHHQGLTFFFPPTVTRQTFSKILFCGISSAQLRVFLVSSNIISLTLIKFRFKGYFFCFFLQLQYFWNKYFQWCWHLHCTEKYPSVFYSTF